MTGKIRVSIVATALHGSDTRPYLNLVNNNSSGGSSSINNNFNYSDNLFNTTNVDNNIVNFVVLDTT